MKTSTLYSSLKTVPLSEHASSVLRTLSYFDVFDFPLTEEEICAYCDLKDISLFDLRAALDDLIDRSYVFRHDNYYSLNPKSMAYKRELSDRLSPAMLKKAYRYSKLISSFPFVRCICLSGSLSKSNVDKNADIDYFIITSPGRLWICRSLLAIFKKVFLLNSRKYFCINYFIDTKHLEIPDKNLFTATEIAFLLPTYNHTLYESFVEKNSWIKAFYPNKGLQSNEKTIAYNKSLLRKSIELLLRGPQGDLLESAFMKMTQLYRKRKFRHMEKAEFEHSMRATKGASKHHPNNFQKKVLTAYGERIITTKNPEVTFG